MLKVKKKEKQVIGCEVTENVKQVLFVTFNIENKIPIRLLFLILGGRPSVPHKTTFPFPKKKFADTALCDILARLRRYETMGDSD